MLLTELLHWMDRTHSITEEQLGEVFKSVFGGENEMKGNKNTIFNLMKSEADECLKAEEGVNFENKIVLSVAIRVLAEKFMVEKINDFTEISKIGASRTPKLFELFKIKFKASENNKILDRVILMAPSNLHLNSFMYEPILDMSDEHLKRLYQEVCCLN